MATYGNPDGIEDLHALPDEERAKMWDNMCEIRNYANEILRLLGAATGEEPPVRTSDRVA